MYQIQADPQVSKYLEERLERSMSRDKDKTGVADRFISDRRGGRYNRLEGIGRVNAGAPSNRNVRWAPRGLGRTPHPGNARQIYQRGLYSVTEDAMPLGNRDLDAASVETFADE